MFATGGSFPGMGPSSVPAPNQGGGSTNVFSQAQSWHGTTSEQSRSIPAMASQHSGFPPTQNMSPAQPVHGMHTSSADHMTSVGAPAVASWSGPSNITQGSQMSHFTGDSSRQRTGSIPADPAQRGQMTQFTGDSSRARASSIPEMMGNVAGNAPMLQQGISHNQVNMGNQGGANLPTMGPHGGGFGSGPLHPGSVPVPSNEGSTVQQGLADTTQEPG